MSLATLRLFSPPPPCPSDYPLRQPPPLLSLPPLSSLPWRPFLPTLSPIIARSKQLKCFLPPSPKPKFRASSPRNSLAQNAASDLFSLTITRRRSNHFSAGRFDGKVAAFESRNHGGLSYGDDFQDDPFWLSLMKEAIRALKSLSEFLVEQPSQLKYIEWPSFKSTLKTAALTLVLVALLIIALSSLDSALCYLMAFFIRRAS